MKTIFVGTNKGLFRLREGRNGNWDNAIFNKGQSVFAVGGDAEKIWAAPFTEWTGTNLLYSTDLGETWVDTEKNLLFPEETEKALAKIWQIVVDRENGRLFAGVEPAALFVSEDDGESWQLCEGLFNHPHCAQWGPGFGGLCLHTVMILDKNTWVVGISTGGVYRTDDGGKTWEASNQKILAPFLPEPDAEFGQCVHKIAKDPENSSNMILQHHWGVYRSTDAGKNWVNVGEGKLPTDFGFACTMNKKDQAFIIPIEADLFRCFPEGKLRVYRTNDSGDTFTPLSNGLPQEDVYDSVLRDCLDSSGDNVCFGTSGGKVYLSQNDGEDWSMVADNLPRITCVRIFES